MTARNATDASDPSKIQSIRPAWMAEALATAREAARRAEAAVAPLRRGAPAPERP